MGEKPSGGPRVATRERAHSRLVSFLRSFKKRERRPGGSGGVTVSIFVSQRGAETLGGKSGICGRVGHPWRGKARLGFPAPSAPRSASADSAFSPAGFCARCLSVFRLCAASDLPSFPPLFLSLFIYLLLLKMHRKLKGLPGDSQEGRKKASFF